MNNKNEKDKKSLSEDKLAFIDTSKLGKKEVYNLMKRLAIQNPFPVIPRDHRDYESSSDEEPKKYEKFIERIDNLIFMRNNVFCEGKLTGNLFLEKDNAPLIQKSLVDYKRCFINEKHVDFRPIEFSVWGVGVNFLIEDTVSLAETFSDISEKDFAKEIHLLNKIISILKDREVKVPGKNIQGPDTIFHRFVSVSTFIALGNHASYWDSLRNVYSYLHGDYLDIKQYGPWKKTAQNQIKRSTKK